MVRRYLPGLFLTATLLLLIVAAVLMRRDPATSFTLSGESAHWAVQLTGSVAAEPGGRFLYVRPTLTWAGAKPEPEQYTVEFLVEGTRCLNMGITRTEGDGPAVLAVCRLALPAEGGGDAAGLVRRGGTFRITWPGGSDLINWR